MGNPSGYSSQLSTPRWEKVDDGDTTEVDDGDTTKVDENVLRWTERYK